MLFQPVLSLVGVVDVRDLKRTRYGRLSVPTRSMWHCQKIICDGDNISVAHGEVGRVRHTVNTASSYGVVCAVFDGVLGIHDPIYFYFVIVSLF